MGRHWSLWLLITPWTVVTRLLCPWGSRGKNTGVGCHSLLQGIFPTQSIESMSPELQADSLPSESPWKPLDNQGIPLAHFLKHRIELPHLLIPMDPLFGLAGVESITWVLRALAQFNLSIPSLWLLPGYIPICLFPREASFDFPGLHLPVSVLLQSLTAPYTLSPPGAACSARAWFLC